MRLASFLLQSQIAIYRLRWQRSCLSSTDEAQERAVGGQDLLKLIGQDFADFALIALASQFVSNDATHALERCLFRKELPASDYHQTSSLVQSF